MKGTITIEHCRQSPKSLKQACYDVERQPEDAKGANNMNRYYNCIKEDLVAVAFGEMIEENIML